MVSGGMAGTLHSLLSAQREYGIAKAISVLLVLSVLIGFAIITLLAYSGALSRVTWWSLGACQLLWFIQRCCWDWCAKVIGSAGARCVWQRVPLVFWECGRARARRGRICAIAGALKGAGWSREG